MLNHSIMLKKSVCFDFLLNQSEPLEMYYPTSTGFNVIFL